MGDTTTLSLEESENQIDEYIREYNAALIFWHHGDCTWKFLLGADAALYKQEMKNLIRQLKNGKIVKIMRGNVMDVKGTQLFPVEVEFKNVECPAYFLVAKQGLTDHYYMTPYLFRSENKRDEVFDYLINNKGSSP